MRFLGLGGTHEVGASSYLYELGGIRLLVDAGQRPSQLGAAALPQLELLEANPPDLMLLTHAHLDHVAALPLVKRMFPHLPVYATRATKRIALEVLSDAVKVSESQGAPLYTLGEVTHAVANMTELNMHQPVSFQGGQLRVYPAGHILGAVGALIETDEGCVFHTGDFSNIAGLTTPAAYQPSTPVPVDAVVSESTYGDTPLPSRKQQVQQFIEAIRGVFEGGGRVLIPTFALGRAQELTLLLVNHMMSGVLPQVPIYLDGLVRSLTHAFEELLGEMPEKLQNQAANIGSPFLREGVTLVKDRKQRERIIGSQQPAVILASSGMLTGGVSPRYARAVLEEPASALFIVGYQDAESPGRRLLELERGGDVLLPTGRNGDFESVPASCLVSRYYLSAHADRVGILAHLSRYPSQHAVLMHGETNARLTLMDALKKDRHVHTPYNGEWVDLLAKSRYARHELRPQASPPSAADDTGVSQSTSFTKIKRFKTQAALTVKRNQLTLKFAGDIDVAHLFPEGTYTVKVVKGRITKADVRQQQDAAESEPATPKREGES